MITDAEVRVLKAYRIAALFRTLWQMLNPSRQLGVTGYARKGQQVEYQQKVDAGRQGCRPIRAGKCISRSEGRTSAAATSRRNWIGGTIPYFMANDGGKISRDQVFYLK